MNKVSVRDLMKNDNGYCGSGRMSKEERDELNDKKKNTAYKMSNVKDIKHIHEIAQIIEKSLHRENIENTMLVLTGDIQLNKLQTWIKDNKDHIVFVAFTESGHVAVVGSGGDLEFPKIEEKADSETPRLLYKVKKRYESDWKDDKKPWEWDKKRAIVVYIKELDEHGEYVLKWREGIETYIGEELFENDVPIINAYSHRNWKMKYWNEWKENEYRWEKC